MANYKPFKNCMDVSVNIPTMREKSVDNGAILEPVDFSKVDNFDAEDFRLGVQLKNGVSMSEISSPPASRNC